MKLTTSQPESIILSAVQKYVEFIAPTYGPAGKKILIVQNEFNHEAVDDGKRSSQAFEIENELENAVIQYIKETTQKGKDGTTTAGLIMGNIVLEAFKDLNNELVTPDYHGLAQGLKMGLTEAVKAISKASVKIKTKEELYAIAHNSYNDDKIAKLIADTIFTIGKDGVLAIEDSKGTETTVEVVNGLEIPKGYHSPYLINQEDKVVLERPAILLVNKKINLFSEVVHIIKFLMENQRPDITIIAEGFGDDVINKCIGYKMMGGLRPLLIETPGFGDRLDNLTDIAVIVGGKVVDDKILKLQDVKAEHLGTCDTIKATKDKTTILGGNGKVKEYVIGLKGQLDKSTNNFEKDTLTKRIAVLSGGVAVIKVGAYTENEQKGIKAKVENAVNSTQIAFKGGVVPGAGKALLDIKTSSELLNEALKAPRKQLELNGAKYLDENTVDPADVVITALESAISIASGLLTIGGISVPKREKKDKTEY
jgi:chaperonin GroEL